MKLLLTSNGISNKTIAMALDELVNKPNEDVNLVFIPTAANIEAIDKHWVINDLNNIKNQGYGYIDIVDPSALPKESWQPRIEKADILFFSGGNTFYLMYWLIKSGLAEMLPHLLETKVYVGISAGSIATAKKLFGLEYKSLYPTAKPVESDSDGLGLVDFYFRPHLNSPHFPNVNDATLSKIAKDIPGKLYALDDQSALMVKNGDVRVVSEGTWKVYN